MTVEYVILGGVLLVMGAVQMWLRYGTWAREEKKTEESGETGMVVRPRGTKVWNTWTAILGPLGLVFGLVLVVLGALGV